jgi:HNH endonuclease
VYDIFSEKDVLMVEVPLTQGKVALIDDEDAERVLAHKWMYNYNHTPAHGYAVRRGKQRENQASVRMHRFILDAPPNMHVDHINGNGLDNRKENLRLATHIQNAQNQRLPRNNTSGFKGVGRKYDRWEARIVANRKRVYIGLFNTKEEAARAYDAAAMLLHGEFARFNFPEESDLTRRVIALIQSAQAA